MPAIIENHSGLDLDLPGLGPGSLTFQKNLAGPGPAAKMSKLWTCKAAAAPWEKAFINGQSCKCLHEILHVHGMLPALPGLISADFQGGYVITLRTCTRRPRHLLREGRSGPSGRSDRGPGPGPGLGPIRKLKSAGPDYYVENPTHYNVMTHLLSSDLLTPTAVSWAQYALS